MKTFTLTLLLLCLVVINTASAAHIVGGEAYYKCISSNPLTQTTKFLVTYTIYRDGLSNGAPFDFRSEFGIYRKLGNQNVWQFVKLQEAIPEDIQEVPFNEPCVISSSPVKVEKATYRFEVELAWIDDVYQISFQRCCRNPTISNIIDPAKTGAAYTIDIHPEAVKNCNNSIVFKNFPPILICAQRALDFDHSISDVEGDSVTYEFCSPLQAGGTAGADTPGDPYACNGVIPYPTNCPPPYAVLQFQSGFSGANPLAGDPQITINPKTGKITGVPRTIGQYVVGVCAKEFRNGKLISVIRRDFQFNVRLCEGPFESIEEQICSGDSVKVNGVVYNKSGTYIQQFTSANGCDSTLTINIVEKAVVEKSISIQKCFNKSITYNGQSYTAAGIFQQTIMAADGCDTLLKILITDFPFSIGTKEYKICKGQTITVNNQNYNQAGQFQQTLVSNNGCDSTLNIVIIFTPEIISNLDYKLCEGNSIVINQNTYSQAGNYEQIIKTSLGCDSILKINISPLPTKKSTLDFKLCKGKLLTVNNETYSQAGSFVQTLTSSQGCDSLLTINIKEIAIKPTELSYKICDDEVVVLNGVTYDNDGKYQQTLQSIEGCDSLLEITVSKSNSQETLLSFSLCDNDKIIVNGKSYTESGQYIQDLQTVKGCDSTLVINVTPCEKLITYDFEKCNASNPANTMIYEEFTPMYRDTLDCGNIVATYIFREFPNANKHSCTPGYNGGIAMCVSSSSNCTYNQQTVKPITFEINIEPEELSIFKFNQISFHQRAPKLFDWIGGSQGLNNYPTKFGIKVFKNGQEVYSSIDLATSFDWKEEFFKFENNAAFEVSKKSLFKIEILPYCLVGLTAIASAWDIDDVNVFISCKKTNNRSVKGQVFGYDGSYGNLVIERKSGAVVSYANIDDNGSFSFKNTKANTAYDFSIKLKDETLDILKNVTTIDLVNIQRHILGTDQFMKNIKFIAADINNDKKLTVTDLVHLRKVMIGFDTKFKKNTSWKFLSKEEFDTTIDPFEVNDRVSIKPSVRDMNNVDFIAVKIGDVGKE